MNIVNILKTLVKLVASNVTRGVFIHWPLSVQEPSNSLGGLTMIKMRLQERKREKSNQKPENGKHNFEYVLISKFDWL